MYKGTLKINSVVRYGPIEYNSLFCEWEFVCPLLLIFRDSYQVIFNLQSEFEWNQAQLELYPQIVQHFGWWILSWVRVVLYLQFLKGIEGWVSRAEFGEFPAKNRPIASRDKKWSRSGWVRWTVVCPEEGTDWDMCNCGVHKICQDGSRPTSREDLTHNLLMSHLNCHCCSNICKMVCELFRKTPGKKD